MEGPVALSQAVRAQFLKLCPVARQVTSGAGRQAVSRLRDPVLPGLSVAPGSGIDYGRERNSRPVRAGVRRPCQAVGS